MSLPTLATPRLPGHLHLAGRSQLVADIGWQPTIAQDLLTAAPTLPALALLPMQPADVVDRLLRDAARGAGTVQMGVSEPASAPRTATATPLPPAATPDTARDDHRDRAAARPAATRTPHRRVLLVGGDATLGARVRSGIGDAIDLRHVDGTDAALRVLMLEAVDVLLLGSGLRDGNPVTLARTVRAMPRLAHVPILLLLDVTQQARRAEALLAGADDVIVGPPDPTRLARTLLPALQGARPRPSLAIDAGDAPDLLRQALARLGEPTFGVREWAACVQLSERQLRRRVLAHVGLSPLAWLREQRLQHVQRLLDDGRCRDLHEAGGHAGLVNPSYLRRLYRARFHAGAAH